MIETCDKCQHLSRPHGCPTYWGICDIKAKEKNSMEAGMRSVKRMENGVYVEKTVSCKDFKPIDMKEIRKKLESKGLVVPTAVPSVPTATELFNRYTPEQLTTFNYLVNKKGMSTEEAQKVVG